eukprot:9265155-Karenia_brevis.AAC.1
MKLITRTFFSTNKWAQLQALRNGRPRRVVRMLITWCILLLCSGSNFRNSRLRRKKKFLGTNGQDCKSVKFRRQTMLANLTNCALYQSSHHASLPDEMHWSGAELT